VTYSHEKYGEMKANSKNYPITAFKTHVTTMKANEEIQNIICTPPKKVTRNKALSPFLVNQVAESERLDEVNILKKKEREAKICIQNRRAHKDWVENVKVSYCDKCNQSENFAITKRNQNSDGKYLQTSKSAQKPDYCAARKALSRRINHHKAARVKRNQLRLMQERTKALNLLIKKHSLCLSEPVKGTKKEHDRQLHV